MFRVPCFLDNVLSDNVKASTCSTQCTCTHTCCIHIDWTQLFTARIRYLNLLFDQKMFQGCGSGLRLDGYGSIRVEKPKQDPENQYLIIKFYEEIFLLCMSLVYRFLKKFDKYSF